MDEFDIIKKRISKYESNLPNDDVLELHQRFQTRRRLKRVRGISTAIAFVLLLSALMTANLQTSMSVIDNVAKCSDYTLPADSCGPEQNDNQSVNDDVKASANVKHKEFRTALNLSSRLLSSSNTVLIQPIPKPTPIAIRNQIGNNPKQGQNLSFPTTDKRKQSLSTNLFISGLILAGASYTFAFPGSNISNVTIAPPASEGSRPSSSASTKLCYPLKTRFSVRAPLPGMTYLSSGLEYSSYRLQTNSQENPTQANLNCIGIPIRIDRTIFTFKSFQLYVGAGTVIDYCFSPTGYYDTGQNRLNASIIGCFGFQYCISNRIGLFIEPELTWTFQTKNQFSSYRTMHPIFVSTPFGIRITL